MMQNLFSAQSLSRQVAVTTTASTPFQLPNAGNTIRIVNEGPNNAYISVAATSTPAVAPSATPSAASVAILAGSDITLSIPTTSAQWFSAICSTGTATLDVQVGEGV